MKCPHCLVDYHPHVESFQLGLDSEGLKRIDKLVCSACGKSNLTLQLGKQRSTADLFLIGDAITKSLLVYPKGSSRPPCPKEVPDDFSEDYKEACVVLVDSPKASAALSRRCLQHLLREKEGVKSSELSVEIQKILDRGTLPTHLSGPLDAIRNIGNFAAHPPKSTASGEIAEVEPGEAEYCLDTIELLFDFYFVQPDIAKTKRAALDAKLKDLGKPAMKQP